VIRFLPLLLGALFLAGCGRAASPAAPVAGGALRAQATVAAPTVTLSALAAHAADPSWEGRRVAVTAGLERATFVLDGDRTCRGYRLVAAGDGLLVANVYTAAGPYAGAPADASRDFAAGPVASLLARGTTAAYVGRFHVARRFASHSGVGEVSAGIELLTIDGKPVAELLRG